MKGFNIRRIITNRTNSSLTSFIPISRTTTTEDIRPSITHMVIRAAITRALMPTIHTAITTTRTTDLTTIPGGSALTERTSLPP
jgi:hypothetical protein